MIAFKNSWLWFTIGLGIALQAGIARAEPVDRRAAEDDDKFMARVVGPSAELAQKVVRSTELAGGKVTLIGFVNFRDESEDHSQGGDSLIGHLLIQISPTRYEHVKFPSCGEEGGAPELLATFFARTVRGGGRDLAVMCKWGSEDTCYAAKFFRLAPKGSRMLVEPVTELNRELETCDEVGVNRKGRWVRTRKAEFKTVGEVKKRLTKMGIDQ